MMLLSFGFLKVNLERIVKVFYDLVNFWGNDKIFVQFICIINNTFHFP